MEKKYIIKNNNLIEVKDQGEDKIAEKIKTYTID